MASTFININGSCDNTTPGSGVSSFNGRTGDVVSVAGDYSSAQVSYDNTSSQIPAANAQQAIDYLAQSSATSASPGFSFGRSGAVGTGTYLQCETVPSNVAGRWVFINNATIEKIFIANELNTTFSLDFFYHDGGGANETLLGSVTVSSDYGGAFPVSWSVPVNKQLSVKLSANSAKNIVCGLSLRGTV